MTAFMCNADKPAYLYARSNTFSLSNLKLPTSSSSLPALLNIVEYCWAWWK